MSDAREHAYTRVPVPERDAGLEMHLRIRQVNVTRVNQMRALVMHCTHDSPNSSSSLSRATVINRMTFASKHSLSK